MVPSAARAHARAFRAWSDGISGYAKEITLILELNRSVEALQDIAEDLKDTQNKTLLETASSTPGSRLYSPKFVKDLKLVGHNAELIWQFSSNRPYYIKALEKIINNPATKPEIKAEAEGYLHAITGSKCSIQVSYLELATWSFK